MKQAALIHAGIPVGIFPSKDAVDKFAKLINADDVVVIESQDDLVAAFTEPQLRRIRAACHLLKDGGKMSEARLNALLETHEVFSKRIKDKSRAATLTWEALITTNFAGIQAQRADASSRMTSKNYVRGMFPTVGTEVEFSVLEGNKHGFSKSSIVTAICDIKSTKYAAGGAVMTISRIAGTTRYVRTE
jgi:hypothetical protein